jgi:hypothetical protein
MGFSDFLIKAGGFAFNVLGDMVASAQKDRERLMKEHGKKLDIAEKKYSEYERKYADADSGDPKVKEQKEKLKSIREKLDKEKEKRDRGYVQSGYSSVSREEKHAKTKGTKTFDDWDSEWICLGPLATANLSPHNKAIGLYRHVVGGKTVYIGRAIEWNNGGFRKRLSDYRRDSDSGRTHTSGKTININLDKIITYVLIVGYDNSAVETTKQLEKQFILHYSPEWNVMFNS